MLRGQSAMKSRPRKNHGVTLIEVLIALTVLLIVFLGLIQAALLTIQSNMKNGLRDEAVAITSEHITMLRGTNFDDMNADGANESALAGVVTNFAPITRTRTFRNSVSVPFSTRVSVLNLDGTALIPVNNKQLTVTTAWAWQGENFTHQVMTMRQR